MSVLVISEAVPNRLRMIYAHLFRKTSGETRERLEALFTPAGLRRAPEEGDEPGATGLFLKSLGQARSMGLVEEDGNLLRLVKEPDDPMVRLGADKCFFELVETRLLPPAPLRDDPQWEFAFALAWLLMQSPMRSLGWSDNPKLLLKRQLGGSEQSFDLTNASRLQNLSYWGRFLGYCVLLPGRIVPDPTAALARHLPNVFGNEQRLQIHEFFQSLARLTPVFEEGAARAELEAIAVDEIRREPQRISLSTSLALRRLEEKGALAFDASSDAQALSLDMAGKLRRISHIRHLEPAR